MSCGIEITWLVGWWATSATALPPVKQAVVCFMTPMSTLRRGLVARPLAFLGPRFFPVSHLTAALSALAAS